MQNQSQNQTQTQNQGTAADTNRITISKGDLHLDNAPTTITDATIGNLLGVAYFIAGIVAVVVMVIAGIRYATANGDSGQIQSAKNMMFYGIIGLVVIIGAAAVTQFVITQVTK